MEKNPLSDGVNSLAEMRKFLLPTYLIATIVYLIFSLHYFTTGLGGTMLLAVTIVPMAYVLCRRVHRYVHLFPHIHASGV